MEENCCLAPARPCVVATQAGWRQPWLVWPAYGWLVLLFLIWSSISLDSDLSPPSTFLAINGVTTAISAIAVLVLILVPRGSRKFATIPLAVILALFQATFWLWLPPPRGNQAMVVLSNISYALKYYDGTVGHLPAATDSESGAPTSWRVEIHRSGFAAGYDPHKAWNDPANVRLQDVGYWRFTYATWDRNHAPSLRGTYASYYKAITGPDTAFDSANPPSLGQLPKNLILIVRVERSDTHWMEPGDLSIEQLVPSEETKRLLLGQDGYAVLFADGPWILSDRLPFSDLCKFFTISGAKQYDRQQILDRYRVRP